MCKHPERKVNNTGRVFWCSQCGSIAISIKGPPALPSDWILPDDAIKRAQHEKWGMLFLIWSNEHSAWWGINQKGYVTSRMKAGRYTLQQAIEACHNANEHQPDAECPKETMVPVGKFKHAKGEG